ncbi:alpha/beta hydrolase [Calycomorphotria hydatis]|uniref:Carboxylesterase NlhH n=1 Tax=Calycomorphotria hydatis TaxID=2528027 RepID=A0A517T7N0_9PLAN|nr:alpha/beta hydrolase [Calycomorphotria hydatis]QDT64382.1 Carboxylesterase NlhH [Calycomorphotria hydatis]
MRRFTLCLSLILLAGFSPSFAAEQTSETNERLAVQLNKQPAADLDNDGILTLTEWKAFAADQQDEKKKKLQALLKKQPQLDTNRDGVLSVEEWTVAANRLRERRAQGESAKTRWLKENPPTQANVNYGPHERNVFDFWQAESDSPTPLVIYIHGGGWVGGSKDSISQGHIEQFRKAGISIAAISYRYSTIAPFPAPLRDGGLAVQYFRAHADELNIDPERVACYGGSAGAATSLWLAFHDDLADPNSDDPVLRESTRLKCAAAYACPTTIDKATMDEWFGMTVATHPAIYPLLNITQESEIYSEQSRRIAKEASAVTHLSSDDPPVYLSYGNRYKPLSADHTPGDVVHHALLGKKLQEKAKETGNTVIVQTDEPEFTQSEDAIDFMIRQLKN